MSSIASLFGCQRFASRAQTSMLVIELGAYCIANVSAVPDTLRLFVCTCLHDFVASTVSASCRGTWRQPSDLCQCHWATHFRPDQPSLLSSSSDVLAPTPCPGAHAHTPSQTGAFARG